LIVDSHQHFWDPARADYPWMTDEVAPIRRRFGVEDLAPLLREHGIGGTVVVQARGELADTYELLELAEATPFVLGVVAWVDLVDPRLAAVIAELRQLPGGAKLVGIRHQVHDEQDPDWLLRADVHRGLGTVAAADLAYDLLVRTRELPAAIETARRLPELRLVLDHLAKPPLTGGSTDRWAALVAQLAELDNVTCKLSGLVTEADWTAWSPDQLVTYFERALDWFGPARCLFGSDWPVCLLAANYGAVLNLLLQAIDGRDEPARAAVLGETAVAVYRLSRPAGAT
jgi:L-fucono-1,5-lactonase